MRKIVTTLALCLAAGLVAFGLGATTQASSQLKDPDVPWITVTGQVDRSKLPDCFVALDHNGDPKKDKQGKTVCIPSGEVYPDPNQPKTTENDKAVKSRKLEKGIEIIEVEPMTTP